MPDALISRRNLHEALGLLLGGNVGELAMVGGILRRGIATAAPALAALLVAPTLGAQAGIVAFGSIILTQLAQTAQCGHVQGTLSTPVLAGVASSGAVLGASLALPPLRALLGLTAPTSASLLLMTATAPAAVGLASVLGPTTGRLSAPRGPVAGARSRG